jgi:NAD dependent epimerase/dehydratase family enzyme
VSIDDEVGAVMWLLDQDCSGPVNITAPAPVTNKEFAKALGRVIHRPARLPTPRFGPELLLGKELADALLFTSAKVHPRVLQGAGYAFGTPELEAGLRRALGTA